MNYCRQLQALLDRACSQARTGCAMSDGHQEPLDPLCPVPRQAFDSSQDCRALEDFAGPFRMCIIQPPNEFISPGANHGVGHNTTVPARSPYQQFRF